MQYVQKRHEDQFMLKITKNVNWEIIWSSRNHKCFPKPLRNMQQFIKETSSSKLIRQHDNAPTRVLRNMQFNRTKYNFTTNILIISETHTILYKSNREIYIVKAKLRFTQSKTR